MGHIRKNRRVVTRRTQFRPRLEVACCLSSTPVSAAELHETTGLPEKDILGILLDLCKEGRVRGDDTSRRFLRHFSPQFNRELERYWDRTHLGAESDVKWRPCGQCGRGYFSTWSGDRTCPRCRGRQEWRTEEVRLGRRGRISGVHA